jgi:uncharacterized membrane protein
MAALRIEAKPRSGGRLRSSFLTGLIVVLPVGLTLWLMWRFAGWTDSVVLPFVPEHLRPERYIGRDLHGIGIVCFLIVTVVVGWLARGWVGQWLIRSAERVVHRTPVVRSIYVGTKQIAEALLTEGGASFETVCLVEYPHQGIWVLGFATSAARGELRSAVAGDDRLIGVFIPTMPNPTTGFLHFVSRKQVIELDMSLEDGVKLIMSGGLVQPRTSSGGPDAIDREAG